MRIDIMTLFPDTVGDMMNESILGRAQERDIIRIEAHQIRDYTANRQNQVDDYPYGGGHGAILQADPLYRCIRFSSPPAARHSARKRPGSCCGIMRISSWSAAITRASTSGLLTNAWMRRFPSAISS